MKSLNKILKVSSFFMVLSILVIFPCQAEQAEPAAYADFDGDGINDHIADSDADGIPDNADPDYREPAPAAETESGAIDFGATISAMGMTADLSTNSDKYGQCEFNCRALTKNRCAFTSEEDFGGEGIGVDVGGGGACAGGVCR